MDFPNLLNPKPSFSSAPNGDSALNHSSLGRNTSAQSNIYTVSRLNAEVRQLLETEMGVVWLVGELSNFVAPTSGHWYFSLKDSRAQVKCAMFKGNNRHVNFTPVNGNQVLIKARLSLYEPRGDYQLIAESMQPEGDGRLQQEFEQLKMKLASEGLFAQNLKQELPKNPTTIGIITSKTGAALYDILNVLKRRDPSLSVIIYPTLVQGVDAPIQIAQAIGRANSRNECDILIVGRGGGSLEDLWGFNHEIVARTIASSQLPIVSAVGHEVDVTIADFVADVRAPTPSAAAELVSRDHSHQLQQLNQKQQTLRYAIVKQLQQQQNQLTNCLHRLEKKHPRYQLERQHQLLDDLNARLHRAMKQTIQQRQQRLQRQHDQLFAHSPQRTLALQNNHLQQLSNRLEKSITHYLQQQKHKHAIHIEKLDAYSPLATLKRGYSITKDSKGKVISKASDVSTGQVITTQFADGSVDSVVE